jgi:predicted DNA-binding protein
MGTRMVRKQLYIPQEIEDTLKRLAQEEGRSEGEIVRELMMTGLEARTTAAQAREEAWQRELDFIKSRQAMEVPQRKRTWKREDAYEDRLSRLSRGH